MVDSVPLSRIVTVAVKLRATINITQVLKSTFQKAGGSSVSS